MSGLSRIIRQQILNHLFGVSTWTTPAAIYVALYTVEPNSIGGGAEINASGYTRMEHSVWSIASDTEPVTTTNVGDIFFNMIPGGETIVAVALFDAAAGGTFLGYDNSINFEIQENEQIIIKSNELNIQLAEAA